MKKNTKFAKFLPVIIVIMITIIVIMALVSIGKALFNRRNNPTNKQIATQTAQTELLSVDTSRSVTMTVRGQIVGDEDFRSHKIIVSPNSRQIIIYKGYLGEIITSKTFPNSPKAYEEFVYALDKANLVKGQALAAEDDDTRGICATGILYEFDMLISDSSINHLWTSTCKGSKGSLVANAKQLQNLFNNQIPDVEQIIRSARKN